MKLIKNILDQNNLDFVIEKNVLGLSLYTILRIICQRRKLENKDIYLVFWTLKIKKDMTQFLNIIY